ncbi:MAG TPA: hypothetical protein PKY56_03155 [Candidatus Kapabacteria bacterium]|nr:hypothetical protein [Candidatus Kapabacteria bacterium]HPO61909.1 hypothetical protein [Candidatus Kapabacteria bacterium]
MKNIKEKISIVILLIINLFFLVKYVERVTEYYLAISVIISIIYYSIYHFRNLIKFKVHYKKFLIFFIAVIYIIFSVILFNLILQPSLNVDRFSVITSFWDSYFNSGYVYNAISHLGNMPGPMPFYFLFALPFYFTGELGFFSLFGLIVFVVILKYSKINLNNQIAGVLLVTCSAFYLWETISRSNIFTNSSLIVLSILFFIHSLNMKKNRHLLINGIIIGLLISTRNVLIIPYIILSIYLLKNKIYSMRDSLKIILIIFTAFVATFLPFVVNHFQEFLEMNPFIIQSSFLMPSWLSIFCILLTFLSFYFIKEKEDIFFYSGFFLFTTIMIYFIYHLITDGLNATFFGSRADISYFILCTPFFFYFILKGNERNSSLQS